MKLSGPLVDSIVGEVHQCLIAAKELLNAKTAESRIRAMHTDRDREFLIGQLKKKDHYISTLHARIDDKPPEKGEKSERDNNRRPRKEHRERHDAPLTHKIPGLDGIKAQMEAEQDAAG